MPTTQIKSLEDAIAAIKDLQNFRREISSQNWDFRQRRIINAHPSVGENDYVVRKELIKFLPKVAESEEPLARGGASGIPNVTFSIWGEVPELTNVTPPCLINAGGTFRMSPVLVYGRCLVQPVIDFKCELYHNSFSTGAKTQILQSQFVILANEFYAIQNNITPGIVFSHLDWASLDTKVAQGISDLEIVVAMRIL